MSESGHSAPGTGGAREHWDRLASRVETSTYWAAHTPVRESVNRWITGEPGLWPVEALRHRWLPHPLGQGLSIGAGTGNLERALRRLEVCARIDAFDLSPVSIAEARRLAAAEGITGIDYEVRDCDRLRLARGRYEIACFHHSLHHLTDPDAVLDEVGRSLAPGGYLYLDEYVGPSRDEWTEATLSWAAEVYEQVPAELRTLPLAAPIDPGDPSEMVRSSRILPAVHARFEIIVEQPYWGNLLFPLLTALDGRALLGPEHRDRLQSWVDRERALVAAGAIREPLFAVVLARKV